MGLGSADLRGPAVTAVDYEDVVHLLFSVFYLILFFFSISSKEKKRRRNNILKVEKFGGRGIIMGPTLRGKPLGTSHIHRVVGKHFQ
jgi:hypothetical protein